MYKKILVPLDGSELAEVALQHVQSLAKELGAEVLLLRVAVNPAFEFALSDPSIAGTTVAKLEAEARAYMASTEAKCKASGLNVTTQIVEGPVADTILKTAEEGGADLIVMSTHGRSGLARWLIGSVADKVVRGSKLPVLLVRPASMNGKR